MEEFVNLRFSGETTSPWSIGRRVYSDFIYCQSSLWGRGVRGPALNYLLKTYCTHAPNERLPCVECVDALKCPFYNLYGTEDDGEFKDTPRLVVSSLTFSGGFTTSRVPLISRSDITNGVSLGPVFIEYIPPNVRFEFEAILTGSAVKFAEEFKEAVRATLALTGWGGRCSRGFGRGRVVKVGEMSFKDWADDVEKYAAGLLGSSEATLSIHPILILERAEGGGFYTSILEEEFRRKLRHSLEERYWQFFKENARLKTIEDVSGECHYTYFKAWSRREGRFKPFEGMSGWIKLRLKEPLESKDSMIIGVAKYGIGRFKNQGFGSLKLEEVWRV